MRLKTWVGLGVALALGGCLSTPVAIDADDVGKVRGELLVFWVGEDRFVYYPAPRNPLTYELPKSLAKVYGVKELRPGVMYTDGGSIPAPVRSMAGLSPWGYAPAYIVHDWLFVAHRCGVLGRAAALRHTDAAQVPAAIKGGFHDSAVVLASIIASLIRDKTVPARGFAPQAIYSAVDSYFARRLWDQTDEKACTPVEETDIAEIRMALNEVSEEREARQPTVSKERETARITRQPQTDASRPTDGFTPPTILPEAAPVRRSRAVLSTRQSY